MSRLSSSCWILSCGLLAVLSGCTQPAADSGPSTPTASQTPSAAAPVDEDQQNIDKALAELSPEDRELAIKQKNCPVGEKPLGSMGPPVKIDLDGRIVFICCEGCESTLRENPAEYLAKLPH